MLDTLDVLREGVAIARVRLGETTNSDEHKRVLCAANSQAAEALQLEDVIRQETKQDHQSRQLYDYAIARAGLADTNNQLQCNDSTMLGALDALREGVAIARVRLGETTNSDEHKRVLSAANSQAAEALQLEDVIRHGETRTETKQPQSKEHNRVIKMVLTCPDAMRTLINAIPSDAKSIPRDLYEKYTSGDTKIGCLIFFEHDAQLLLSLYKVVASG